MYLCVEQEIHCGINVVEGIILNGTEQSVKCNMYFSKLHMMKHFIYQFNLCHTQILNADVIHLISHVHLFFFYYMLARILFVSPQAHVQGCNQHLMSEQHFADETCITIYHTHTQRILAVVFTYCRYVHILLGSVNMPKYHTLFQKFKNKGGEREID